MENKKSIEQKLAEKLVTKERVEEMITNCGKSQRVTGLEATPVVGDWVYKDILETEVYHITEEIGQRDFSFKQFKKDVVHETRTHLEEYLKKFKEADIKLKL